MPADPVQLHPEKTAQPPIAPRAEAPVATDHTHAALDRLMRAEMARFTDGVSPYATAKALIDWATHLARAPGRQMELAEWAAGDMGRLWAHKLARQVRIWGATFP
jgi:polyhydroxyalkanoate synthase